MITDTRPRVHPVAPAGPQPGAGRRRLPGAQPYLLLLPCLAVIVVLVLYPLGLSLFDSVHVDNPLAQGHAFVGARNYLKVLTDPAFVRASLNTVGYLILATVGALVVGMVMAVWLHGIRRFRAVFLVAIVLPWAVPGTVNGVLWSFIFNPTNGLLNAILKSVHLISHNVIWLEGSVTGIAFISVSLIWQIAPISAVIFLAGLESIPTELYEQAAVDGASALGSFRRITVPLLRPALAIGLLEAGVLGIGIFDQAYVLAGYAPSTISAVQQIYLYAFQDFNFGLGIASSVVVTVATLALSLFYLKVVYREMSY